MIKIACQTIVFGNPTIKDNLGKYAETVKNCGYEGIEIGIRHFYQDRLEYYRELFERLALQLIIHLGGDFTDKDSVKAQLDNVKNTIIFGKKLGSPYLYMSGTFKENKTLDNYYNEAESYKTIGKACNDEGLILCYHNHDWEFKNSGEGMKALLEKVPPEYMKLVPDVGWLEQAGVNAVNFLKANINRVEAIHFKDYKKLGVTPRSAIINEVTELGRGIVPFAEIYNYLAGLGRDWWITAEQDQTQLDPAEAARINYECINNLRK